jgi:hypothetical protein
MKTETTSAPDVPAFVPQATPIQDLPAFRSAWGEGGLALRSAFLTTVVLLTKEGAFDEGGCF